MCSRLNDDTTVSKERCNYSNQIRDSYDKCDERSSTELQHEHRSSQQSLPSSQMLQDLQIHLANQSYSNAADQDTRLVLSDSDCGLRSNQQALIRSPRPARPTKTEADLDSQSPIYKTDWFRMFHFKVILQEANAVWQHL